MQTGEMSKKIVGIVGSYRKGRVIDTAVTEVLKGAESAGAETVKINLTEKQIEFCNNCRSCMQQPGDKRGQCVHDDDMKEILQRSMKNGSFGLSSGLEYARGVDKVHPHPKMVFWMFFFFIIFSC